MLVLAAGCSGAGGAGSAAVTADDRRLPNLAAEEQPYLPGPLTGYALGVSPEVEQRLSESHHALLEGGDLAAVEAARGGAGELLAIDPQLHPARVLKAQADFAAGRLREAAEEVRAVAEELPDYVAAGLLLGRASEKLGEAAEAFAVYRALAEASPTAAQRAQEVRPRALEIIAHRVEEGLRRGRLDLAETELVRLESWAPGEAVTLEAASEVARARGDGEAELAAVRGLARLEPERGDLTERWADLELDVGDPGVGLELVEKLVAARPEDPVLQEKLGYAKFRWRLTLLPQRVQEVAGRAELQRGDWAVLLYWLFPSVRYGEVSRPRIAADILDDPRREEIARVVNLGLMEVNEVLHRFSPDEPATRATVLDSLLRLLSGAEKPLACTRDLPAQPSWELACSTAARCALLPSVDDCLPAAPVSGREGLEFLRRTLELVGAQ